MNLNLTSEDKNSSISTFLRAYNPQLPVVEMLVYLGSQLPVLDPETEKDMYYTDLLNKAKSMFGSLSEQVLILNTVQTVINPQTGPTQVLAWRDLIKKLHVSVRDAVKNLNRFIPVYDSICEMYTNKIAEIAVLAAKGDYYYAKPLRDSTKLKMDEQMVNMTEYAFQRLCERFSYNLLPEGDETTPTMPHGYRQVADSYFYSQYNAWVGSVIGEVTRFTDKLEYIIPHLTYVIEPDKDPYEVRDYWYLGINLKDPVDYLTKTSYTASPITITVNIENRTVNLDLSMSKLETVISQLNNSDIKAIKPNEPEPIS